MEDLPTFLLVRPSQEHNVHRGEGRELRFPVCFPIVNCPVVHAGKIDAWASDANRRGPKMIRAANRSASYAPPHGPELVPGAPGTGAVVLFDVQA
jgi:hypothetical protein